MPACELSFEALAFVYALITAAFACGFGLACAFRGCDDVPPRAVDGETEVYGNLFVGAADEERCQTLSGRDEARSGDQRVRLDAVSRAAVGRMFASEDTQ